MGSSDFRQYLGWIKNYGFNKANELKTNRDKMSVDMCNGFNLTPEQKAFIESQSASLSTIMNVVRFPDKDVDVEELNNQIRRCVSSYIIVASESAELSEAIKWAFAKKIQQASASLVYCDDIEDGMSFYKSDFGVESFRSHNFVGQVICFSKDTWNRLNGFDKQYKNGFIYDFVLRAVEHGAKVAHVANVMATYPVTLDYSDDKKILAEHMKRLNKPAEIEEIAPGYHHVTYKLDKKPFISIIIPNKDHVEDLSRCIKSINALSVYENYEILVVENNSEDPATFEYYETFKVEDKVRVITYQGGWNYADINNFAVDQAKGEYILFLNNDTQVRTADFLEQMMAHLSQKRVGAVGAKLIFEDKTIQHAGVVVGIRGIAGHCFYGVPSEELGYYGRINTTQNLSAVTAACLMMRKSVFKELEGFDTKLAVAFNDVDLCMRIRRMGMDIIYEPKAELFHFESKSRGDDNSNRAGQKRFAKEYKYFAKKWCKEIAEGDPFYNRHLTLEDDDFSVEEG